MSTYYWNCTRMIVFFCPKDLYYTKLIEDDELTHSRETNQPNCVSRDEIRVVLMALLSCTVEHWDAIPNSLLWFGLWHPLAMNYPTEYRIWLGGGSDEAFGNQDMSDAAIADLLCPLVPSRRRRSWLIPYEVPTFLGTHWGWYQLDPIETVWNARLQNLRPRSWGFEPPIGEAATFRWGSLVV